MLSGFRLRCATGKLCRYTTPSKNCTASNAALSSEKSKSNKGVHQVSTISLPSITSKSGMMCVCSEGGLP